jgi:hypothetical protein
MKYRLYTDNDGHWYKVPVEQTEEFDSWLELDSEDEASWTPPEGCIEIDGPHNVVIQDPVEVEVVSAINFEKYKSNSLVVAKVGEEVLRNSEMVEGLKRAISDFKSKFNVDDSTYLLITAEDFDVQGFTEEDMAEMGWFRKND